MKGSLPPGVLAVVHCSSTEGGGGAEGGKEEPPKKKRKKNFWRNRDKEEEGKPRRVEHSKISFSSINVQYLSVKI